MSDNTLSIIKSTAQSMLQGSKVYLFGSRSRQDNKPTSDYDILLITQRPISSQQKSLIKSGIRKELAKFGIPVDVLIYSEKEIEVRRKLPGHIIREVINEIVQV